MYVCVSCEVDRAVARGPPLLGAGPAGLGCGGAASERGWVQGLGLRGGQFRELSGL